MQWQKGVGLLQLLAVAPLTDLEEDSDIRNMPRLLRTLGIDGVFYEETVRFHAMVDELLWRFKVVD